MTRRDLTKEEEQIPVYLDSPFIEDDICFANWDNQLVWSELGISQWYFDSNNKEIQDQDFEEQFPGYSQLTNVQVDKETFTAKYQGAYICWSFKKGQWRYRNHKPVNFQETKDAQEVEQPPELEDKQAKVSQLLESTVQTVSALVTRLSRPQTPQTPQTLHTTQALPGQFPSTPGPSSQVSVLPTPAATVIATPAHPPVSQTLPVNPAPPVQAPVPVAPPVPRIQAPVPAQVPVRVQVAPPVPPVAPAIMAANPPPKLIGAPPEPYDGSPQTVVSFWTTLANYYYLNADAFTNEGKKVSSALTYFKLKTSAGEWARDRQKEALALTPVDFGNWADFKTAFENNLSQHIQGWKLPTTCIHQE